MEHLNMKTKNIADENFVALKQLFPNAVSETIDTNGKLIRTIDKDILMQEINNSVVEGKEERYQMTWPKKRESIMEANTPIDCTFRPSKEESVDFDSTQNLYLEGDNVNVLKLLKETYLNKLDVIYIDPPYNTGNDILYKNDYGTSQDEFSEKYEIDSNGNRVYVNTETNGKFHTDWMNMMYQRVKLSKPLLKETGFFLIAIDHNELFNLGEICDEIFGYSNRIGIISVVHKPEGRNQAKFIGPSNEFMLIYAKNEAAAKLQKVALDEEQIKTFECTDDKGAYRLKDFIRLADGKYATRESKPNFWYPIYVSNDLSKLELEEFPNSTAVYPVTIQGVERTWKTTPDTFLERYKNGDIIAKKENDRITIYEKLREDEVIKTHWIAKKYHGFHFGTKILDDLLGVKTFDFPKSLYLMHDIIKLFAPKDGLILDYFSGSATTAHATMLLNSEDGGTRKFILAQIPAACDEKSEAYKAGYKNICEIGKERIRRAGKKIKETAGLLSNNLDIGFRVLKLDSSNMEDIYYTPQHTDQTQLQGLIDNVKPDRTSMDLLFQVMLEYGINLSSKIEVKQIDGKEVYFVEDTFLIACFDKSVNDKVVTEIANAKPQYACLRDMDSDATLTNFEQIFKALSPNTVCKVL